MGGQDVVLRNRYRLVRYVGSGAMGEVWRARDLVLGREVAVKLLHSGLMNSPRFSERFRDEARILASLKHHGVVTVHDFGESDDPRAAFLVMDLLDGRPLSELTDLGEPLGVVRTLSIVVQVLDALRAVHERGITHRDLKPANLMLGDGDKVIVTDFGVARAVGAARLTSHGMVMGTPQYSAPEQAGPGEVTASADLYAVGVIAYECLCGQPPFYAEDPESYVALHASAPVPDMPEGIPDAVRKLVLRALSKAPEDRFADAAEMADAVQAALVGLGADGVSRWRKGDGTADRASRTAPGRLAAVLRNRAQAGRGGTSVPKQRPWPTPSVSLGAEPGRRRVRAIVLTAAAVVLCVGVAAVLTTPQHHRARPSASGPPSLPASANSAPTAGGPLSTAPHPSRSPRPTHHGAAGGPAVGPGTEATGGPPTGGPATTDPATTGPTTPSTVPTRTPTTPAGGPYSITASVTCDSGKPVDDGLYVQADTGRGEATKVVSGGVTTWRRTLPKSEYYTMHIGCGTDANREWEPLMSDGTRGLHTEWVTGTYHAFACHDVQGAAGYGKCEERPGA
ncbi:protein kinase [Streptomyces sp. NPDC088910]|uniref:serine/threonine-protein kinase n=1 Tax=Streptomyces sp. NPDC088910 TaxID=3365911 RepID=UPI0038282B7B